MVNKNIHRYQKEDVLSSSQTSLQNNIQDLVGCGCIKIEGNVKSMHKQEGESVALVNRRLETAGS